MTIALAINVGDSLVLASDSATTQQMLIAGRPDTTNVWNSANKIFNLHRSLPIAAMTWGAASIGGRSIATWSKDLRVLFMEGARDGSVKPLDLDSYSMTEVMDRTEEFFCSSGHPLPDSSMGLLVGGYSAGENMAEWYSMEITDSGCQGRKEVLPPGEAGVTWYGQPEAISRLVSGLSIHLPQALVNLGVSVADVPDYVARIASEVSVPIIFPGMPVGEVIDLAEFLVETTIKYVRFTPGHAVVGGPIEIAAVTKHEGFKWIKRKHHFPANLNPER